jgi:hypothetical protein
MFVWRQMVAGCGVIVSRCRVGTFCVIKFVSELDELKVSKRSD